MDGFMSDKSGKNPEVAKGGHETVEFLLRRMRHKGDLPAFSKHIVEINSKLSSFKSLNQSAMGDLANIILKDFSLTNKLLRIVNSAIYGTFSGKVVTVSKAVLLLGFEKVRMIASALLIFEHLQNKSQAVEFKEAAMASFMSGIIAMDLSEKMKMGRAEEAFICGMLYNLGKLLVICYFPEEYEEIVKQMDEQGTDEGKAVHDVLGISYNQLGMAVSRAWNFPETIVRSLEKPPPGVIDPPKTEHDIMRNLTNYANDLCDVIVKTEETQWSKAITIMADRYQKTVPLQPDQMESLLGSAAEKIHHFSDIVKVDEKSSKLISRLSTHLKTDSQQTKESAPFERPSQEVSSFKKTPNVPKSAETETPDQTGAIVSNGIKEIADVMKGSYSLHEVMYMILETMYRGCEFSRVIFCLRDVQEMKMVARFGLGEDAERIIPFFRIQIGQLSDIFNIAIAKGRGVIIEDADVSTIAQNLPEWYRTHVAAPAFLVYPLVIKGNCIGLFYADKSDRGTLLSDNQHKYMDDLHSMAVDVITQKQG